MSFDNINRRAHLRRHKSRFLPILAFVVTIVFVTFLLVPWIGMGRNWSNENELAVYPATVIGLIARSKARAWAGYDLTPQEKRYQVRFRRWAWVVAIVFMGLISSQIWSCPHGTGIQFGPFVVTLCGPDGMCRNDVQLGHRYRITETLSFYWAF